ncbi:MAG: hypothetical protein WCQ47_00555 [bacterium]
MKLHFILIMILSVYTLTSCEKKDDVTLEQAKQEIGNEEIYHIDEIDAKGDSLSVRAYTQGNKISYDLFYLKKGNSKEGTYTLIRETFVQIVNYKNSLVCLNDKGEIYIANNTIMYARIPVDSISKIKSISIKGDDIYATDEQDKLYVYRGGKNTNIFIQAWTSFSIFRSLGAIPLEIETGKKTKPKYIRLSLVK